MSPDLYDDLVEFLRDQEDADLVDGHWKPNEAMKLLQRLEEEHARSLSAPEREGWMRAADALDQRVERLRAALLEVTDSKYWGARMDESESMAAAFRSAAALSAPKEK